MTRSSFKVLLGASATPLDNYLEAMTRQWLEDRIAGLPPDKRTYIELSFRTRMGETRCRRLCKDLGIKVG